MAPPGAGRPPAPSSDSSARRSYALAWKVRPKSKAIHHWPLTEVNRRVDEPCGGERGGGERGSGREPLAANEQRGRHAAGDRQPASRG